MKAVITGNNQQNSFSIGSIIEGHEVPLGLSGIKYIPAIDQYGISMWVLSEDYKVLA